MIEIGKKWMGSRRSAADAEGLGSGQGYSPASGVGSEEGAMPPPQKIFDIFA